MGQVQMAALDPIFYLHHCNIDRVWDDWLGLGGNRANPTETAWLDQSFSFFDADRSQVSLTGRQVLDHASQLGYIYT